MFTLYYYYSFSVLMDLVFLLFQCKNGNRKNSSRKNGNATTLRHGECDLTLFPIKMIIKRWSQTVTDYWWYFYYSDQTKVRTFSADFCAVFVNFPPTFWRRSSALSWNTHEHLHNLALSCILYSPFPARAQQVSWKFPFAEGKAWGFFFIFEAKKSEFH